MDDLTRQAHIMAHLEREKGKPEIYWWLSFADDTKPKGTQFLGVAIIKAPGPAHAIQRTHQLGINPGGECLFGPSPYQSEPPEGWNGRLVRERKEVERLEKVWNEASTS